MNGIGPRQMPFFRNLPSERESQHTVRVIRYPLAVLLVAGWLVLAAVRAPLSGSAQAAASSKGRLPAACHSVVVPPAKDAASNVTLAVKASVVHALASSGNRTLENVAKSIKDAGRHKREAKFVRDELLKAASTCHKLGIRTGK